MANLPSRRHRRNVKVPVIKKMDGTSRYGIWVPGHSYPVGELKIQDGYGRDYADKVVLEVRQNGLGGRLTVRPCVSNVIEVEMVRE